MKGSHHITVQNRYLKYEFTIRRNLTILAGQSATGKTTLVEMIRENLSNGIDSGVSMTCDVPCRVIAGNLWREQLPSLGEAIIFIDEGNHFVTTKEFAEAIQHTGHYYVIVTRESLEMLLISVNEIYGIRTSGKYGGLYPVYHELYQIYQLHDSESVPIRPERIITEDSNAGYEFFNTVANDNGLSCLSAAGKSNVFRLIDEDSSEEETVIIADGAAFGSQMNKIESAMRDRPHMHLFLPESFEWLLLQSGIFKNSKAERALVDPPSYIDSAEYFSWEQFFTALLRDISEDHYLKYTKHRLNPNYLQEKIKTQILKSIKGIQFSS